MKSLALTSGFFILVLFLSFSLPGAEELPTMSLSEAVETALQKNPTLNAMRKDTRAASLQRREEESAFWPQISYLFQYSNSHSERYEIDTGGQTGAGGFDFDNVGFTGAIYDNKFQLSQLIFDRSVLGRIFLADIQKKAAKWQEIGQEQQVIESTVSAYLDVLRAKELLEVQEQRLQLATRQLETASSSFEVGMRIRTDVLRAQLTQSSARRDMVSAEIQLKRAQVALNQVMGIPMSSRHDFEAGSLTTFSPSEEIVDVLESYPQMFGVADEYNPSIKVASTMVEQYQESVDIAKGEFLPRVRAGASWGWNESGHLAYEDEEWRVQASVEMPLFEGGRKLAKVSRTKEQLEGQRERFQDTKRQVYSMIEQSALALQEEHRNLEIAMEEAMVADENHERFLNLYEEGLVDSLDVTQALTEKVEADTNVVTTRYGFLKLYIQLLASMGTIPTEAGAYQERNWLQPLKFEGQSEGAIGALSEISR